MAEGARGAPSPGSDQSDGSRGVSRRRIPMAFSNHATPGFSSYAGSLSGGLRYIFGLEPHD